LKQPQFEERERQLAQINQELPAVLRQLLGINYERELNKYFVDADEDDHRLAFLSEDKRSQLLAARDQFEGRREQLLYGQTGTLTPEQTDKLRQIDQEQDAALSGLLSPGEKEQYELTVSPSADYLRGKLIGFNPTESEFQDLFRRQKAIDDAYEFQDASDPAVQAAKAADEDKMMEEFKGQLTGDRAAQLDRSQNPDYQNLSILSERFDLPAGTPETLLEMRQDAETEKQKLLANKDIPPDRVAVALQAIQAETEKATQALLGEKAYAQYSQTASWITRLGTN
jgi:hypothetical protein